MSSSAPETGAGRASASPSGPSPNPNPSLWSTASLRLAAIFSLIFALGGAGLIAAADFGLMRAAEAEVRGGLAHQMAIMRQDADRLGGGALADQLNAQPRNRDARRYLLLVAAPDGRTFSNGLTPAAANESGFRRNLATKGRPARWPDQTPDMLVLSQRAADGSLLAVGRDTQHLSEFRNSVRAFAIWSGLALVALAILAGLMIGHLFLRRLDGVNQAVGRIIAGRTSERLPPIGFGREFDGLAANLNRMLDRQEATLSALKSMSEGLAHDLRTPLARVRNRLEEAEALDQDPAARHAALEQAQDEMAQLDALFESLLTLARIEGGAGRLNHALLDVAALAERVAEIYRPVVEEAGGRLTISPSDVPLMALGDAPLLQQALANLIENAVHHADGGADVTVTAGRRGQTVVLGVSDRGPGVPEAERDAVLRRFHRLDRSRSRPGSGLGLPMAAAAARAHQGELALTDNQPGLRVEIILPAHEARP